MDSVQQVHTTLQALRRAAVKGKTKKPVLEAIDNVSSLLLLLSSSSPSSLTFDQLVAVLRAPLAPLYSNYTEATLNVTSAILKLVLDNCIQSCMCEVENGNADCQAGWERAAHSLLSGVIDFLESNNNGKTKTTIGKALYAPICDFFFFKDKLSNVVNIGVTLRCTAYMLLSDTATLHTDNQSKLRDQEFLGADALGLTISKTRDFAVLEALLNLFAILLPSSSTPQKRNSYIQGVFSDYGKELVELLDEMSTRQWDETAAGVIDILAASDISFPQPFDVDEVIVCANKYPQPEVSDRLYIDRTCFFVNVQQEDDLYEDLQIRYTDVKAIRISPAGGKTTPVSITLKTTPKLGDQDIPVQNELPMLRVDILNPDMPRFKEALLHRKLDGMIATTKKLRISVSESLDLDEHRPQWQKASLVPSQKVKDVESSYELDPRRALSEERRAGESSAAQDSAVVNSANISLKARAKILRDTSHRSTALKLNPSIGGTDEELSSIDKADDLPVKMETMNSAVREPVGPSANVPADIIVLSDNEPEVEVKSTSSVRKSSEKRVQRRHVESDGEDNRNEANSEDVQGTEMLAASKEPATNRARSTVLRSGKSAVPAKGSDTARDTASSGRPRRTAAATASVKVAKVLAGSEDTLVTTKKDSNPSLMGFTPDGTVIHESHASNDSVTYSGTTSARQKSQKTKTAKAGTRARPVETTDLRSSSPTSKISRMKAKNPGGSKTTNARGRKRPADKAFIAKEEVSSRKKPRTITESSKGNEKLEGRSKADSQSSAAHTLQARRNCGPHEAVDWDNVPFQSVVRTKEQKEHPVTPVKTKAPDEGATKEENIRNHKNTSKCEKPANVAADKPEGRTRARVRVPLQSVSLTQNKASKQLEIESRFDASPLKTTIIKKSKNCQPDVDASTNEKNVRSIGSILPALQDTLLEDAVIEETKIPQKTTETIETAHDEDNDQTNFDTGAEGPPFCHAIDLDQEPGNVDVFQDQNDKLDVNRHERPHTPSSNNLIQSMPLRIPTEKRLKKVLDLDPEVMDLTDEDIKDVLQKLRDRRAKKERELGNAILQLELTKKKALGTEDKESSADENDIPVLQNVPQRPKVTFDYAPRYKSASLESLPVQDAGEPHNFGTARRKYRLPESKPVPRGPCEPASRKPQEKKEKKEPGMEDVINVLDAIQDAIVSNISNKTRTVQCDVRAARDRLIHDAVADLHAMREESVGHYDNLLELENEYANINRRLNAGFENMTNVNADVCKFVRQTIGTHGRESLSKKLPQTLFTSALPVSFQKSM